MGVSVEPLPPALEQLGWTRDALRIDTEQQLREHGIRVLSTEELRKAPSMTWLDIHMRAVGGDYDSPFATSTRVQFEQPVSLMRDPSTSCCGVTWIATSVARVPLTKLGEMRNTLRDLISLFIDDYLAVNPKQPPKQEDHSSEAQHG
jgi:hypothetical protein